MKLRIETINVCQSKNFPVDTYIGTGIRRSHSVLLNMYVYRCMYIYIYMYVYIYIYYIYTYLEIHNNLCIHTCETHFQSIIDIQCFRKDNILASHLF